MGRGRRHSAEVIGNLLDAIQNLIATGKSTSRACCEVGISEPTYYRWRAEFGELKGEQLQRLFHLEKENMQLRNMIAELTRPGRRARVSTLPRTTIL